MQNIQFTCAGADEVIADHLGSHKLWCSDKTLDLKQSEEIRDWQWFRWQRGAVGRGVTGDNIAQMFSK